MTKNILTIVFCMAGSAAICWLCDWRTKVIAWMIIFWVVIAVGMAVHRPRPSDAKNEQRAADISRRKRIFDGG